MSALSITPTTTAPGATAPGTVSNPNDTLNEQDFLKILVAQMQNQDPMNPQDPTQEVGQMTQFAMLQAMQEMSQTLTAQSFQSSISEGNSMIGKTVTYANSDGSTVTGSVTGMNIDQANQAIQLVLSDNSTINLDQVQQVNG